MKKTIKKYLSNSLLIMTAALNGVSYAHSYTGSLTSGVNILNPALSLGASTTDTFLISCFLDPAEPSQLPADHLFIDINEQTVGGGQMSATAMILNNTTGILSATTVTDLVNGDNIASAGRTLRVKPNGNTSQDATFYVIVSHTAAGAQNYQMDYHCQDINGVHVGTTDNLTPSQNQ